MPQAGSFETDVVQAMRVLQPALTALFAALNTPIRSGADLHRALGVPLTVSWQMHSVVSMTDPIAAAAQVPGRHSTKRFFQAAAKRVPAPVLERAAEAYERFEACAALHAGDRPTLASMLNGLKLELATGKEQEARREAYHMLSSIYGVQRAAAFGCCIAHPSATEDRYDFALVTGSAGFRTMREFEKLCVGRHGHVPGKPGATPPNPSPVRPVDDPGGELAGVPLLREFCSKPPPRFTAEPVSDLYLEIYLSGQPVGRTGESTFTFAEHWPGLIPTDENLKFGMTTIFPTEVQIHDVLLAPSVAERIRDGAGAAPDTAVYGGAYHDMRLKAREVDRLRTPAQSSYMGQGVEALQTTDAPRHVEMLRFVCAKLGWDADAMHAYRCRVEYPVLHSFTNVCFSRA